MPIEEHLIRNAGSGGENASLNTRDFTVSVSTDGRRFSEVVRVTGNTAGITRHDVTPVSARWIRLDAITPTSTSDRTVRIYEFEAYQASTPAG